MLLNVCFVSTICSDVSPVCEQRRPAVWTWKWKTQVDFTQSWWDLSALWFTIVPGNITQLFSFLIRLLLSINNYNLAFTWNKVNSVFLLHHQTTEQHLSSVCETHQFILSTVECHEESFWFYDFPTQINWNPIWPGDSR